MESTDRKRSYDEFRGEDGRFLAGNPGGPGNPFAAKSARVSAAFYAAIDEEKIFKLIQSIQDRAAVFGLTKADKVTLDSLTMLLDRMMGKPVQKDFEAEKARMWERIRRMEEDRKWENGNGRMGDS